MSFAGITGWISLALLAVSFCTPVKSPKLNQWLGGYRSQIKIHHWAGLAAATFIALHLAVLVFDYSSSLQPLFEFSDPSISAGWLAFICSVLVVAVAFRFRSTPYRRWRRIHLISILAFVAATLHSLLVLEPRTVLEWGAIAVVVLIGGTGIAWSLWIPQLPSFGFPYLIDKQKMLRPDLVIQTLVPSHSRKHLSFEAGQFVFLRYVEPQFTKMWHPFTVVGFSTKGEFQLLIKTRGRDTNQLRDIALPSSVRINGPFGENFWGPDLPQIWIAYGVGIAIFLAAARTMPRDIRSNIRLIYCEKTRDHIVFGDEFNELSAQRNNFSWTQSFGEGRDVIDELKEDVFTWKTTYQLFRICGHPGFQASLKRVLMDAGVKSNSIILEGVF